MIAIDLSNSTALVTGAGGGIGRAIATTLGAAGATVACNYAHHRDAAEQTVAQVEGAGGEGWALQGSVAHRPDVEAMAEQVRRRRDHLDILVLNAVAQDPFLPMLEQTAESFQSQIDTCMWQVIHAVQVFAPMMPDGGRIILINTECILQSWPGQGAYVGAKMGMHGYARVLARELGPRRITVNEVAPGWIRTYRDQEKYADDPNGQDDGWYRSQGLPFPERGRAEDIASCVLFLASDLAPFVSGALIPVNGALSLV